MGYYLSYCLPEILKRGEKVVMEVEKVCLVVATGISFNKLIRHPQNN